MAKDSFNPQNASLPLRAPLRFISEWGLFCYRDLKHDVAIDIIDSNTNATMTLGTRTIIPARIKLKKASPRGTESLNLSECVADKEKRPIPERDLYGLKCEEDRT